MGGLESVSDRASSDLGTQINDLRKHDLPAAGVVSSPVPSAGKGMTTAQDAGRGRMAGGEERLGQSRVFARRLGEICALSRA